MMEYEPNSHKYKEAQKNAPVPTEKKEIKKVVSGPVKAKKKSGVAKLAEVFVAEDAQNIKSYIVDDVLIPAARKGIWDLITGTLDMLLNGKRTTTRSGRTYADRVSYENYSKSGRDRDRDRDSRPRNAYSYEEQVIDSRSEAEEVLERMRELLDLYGTVSVADYYELCGKVCEYTDNNYGWTDLRRAEVMRYRDGYVVELPRPHPLHRD